MFGADNATGDPRKGYDLLEEALRTLGCSVPKDAVQVIIFGTKDAYRTTIEGFDARSFGFVADEYLMALLYGTADVVVVPSRADNLPFTAIESLACGTPVVGFGIGGIPEIVDHKKNGYVAQPLSPKDLAKGIEWILFHSDAQSLGKQAREKADSEYAINVQVARYLSLINEKFGIS
jgi:glycosyltransferase involved in cell wall biosynthesis